MNNENWVFSLQTFKVTVHKDCSQATFTGGGWALPSIEDYKPGDPAITNTFTLPILSDPYCELEYALEVTRSDTGATLPYTHADMFSSPDISAVPPE